jgi:hypothetical protein
MEFYGIIRFGFVGIAVVCEFVYRYVSGADESG